ncbi:hypothetical protein AB0D08_02635 [Kitasatospora sp. NPDC048540]|uniref:hypothetical protein n=1 Tax=Kitasatospora sp. NPDC048540 TaxID=3155634 RepID=UPI0033E26680
MVGPVGALLRHLVGAATALLGPALLAGSVTAGTALRIVGAGFTLVMTPLGIGVMVRTRRERADNRSLDRSGSAATAEVIALTTIPWDGEVDGVRLRVRISGPGFRPFEAAWDRSAHSGLRVGRLLPATVDPVDGRFRVRIPARPRRRAPR